MVLYFSSPLDQFHFFDRSGSSPHPHLDPRSLKSRTGSAGTGIKITVGFQADLGIGADIQGDHGIRCG